jgi:hypothetical protein
MSAAAAELLYPVTPRHPPLRVKVFVHWRGRIFVAWRDTHPNSRRPCWATNKTASGELWYLPPRNDAKRETPLWGRNPDSWRPLKPGAWKAPLPPPFTATVDPTPRLVDIRPSRRRIRGRRDGAAIADKAPWWWDATSIRYEPPGQVSQIMAEGRLMRALWASGANTRVKPATPSSATMLYGWTAEAEAAAAIDADAEAKLPVRIREQLALGPADGKDWGEAMRWFAGLGRVAPGFHLRLVQEVLVHRARRRSYPTIARILDISVGHAHNVFMRGLERVWHIANNGEATANDHAIASVQAGNRAYKRQGGLP